MKKLFLFLFLLSVCLKPVYANEFWVLEDNPESVVHSPLGLIIKQQPIKFSVVTDNPRKYPTEALTDYTYRGFTHWFEKLQEALADPQFAAQRDALAGYAPAIAFGAKKDSFVPTYQSAADIRVYFMQDEVVHRECSHNKAVGCMLNNGSGYKKVVYFVYPPWVEKNGANVHFPLVRTILHEFGHVWGLDDLYTNNHEGPRRYGSGVRTSIMNMEKGGLTCDDLDGMSHMLYFAAKMQNPAEPDLVLPSFCATNTIYVNGVVLNKEVLVTNEPTHREYTYYCSNGKKAFSVGFNPLDFEHLLVKEDVGPCDGEEVPAIMPQTPYRQLDQAELQLLTNMQNFSSKSKVFYKPLITGKEPLDLFVHVGDKIPVYAYILDGNKQVVFLFAHLKEGKNWVYSGSLTQNNPSLSSLGKQVLIYNREKPTNFTSWQDRSIHGTMSSYEIENNINLQQRTLRYFQNYLPVFMPYANADPWEKGAVEKLISWDNYLTQVFLQEVELEKDVKRQLQRALKK